MKISRISVIGLGKLGLPLAACLAYKGFRVLGVDCNLKIVSQLTQGKTILYETGLLEKLKTGKQNLSANTNIRKSVLKSQATFILLPTPSGVDGTFSLKYIFQAARELGEALRLKKEYQLVVLTSTVMPGDTRNRVKILLEKISGKKCGKHFGLCYNPEFIALGSAIHDLSNPDFVLIGESDKRAGDLLEGLYRKICDNHPPVARMSFINAEITKLAVNTFATTKISFANMLSRLCEKLPGADVDVVTQALGFDSRIGGKYLKGAIGYGGPCFPRDNRALVSFSRAHAAPVDLAETTDRFNRNQTRWLFDFVKSYLPPGGRVGILGLSYKPGSDVLEEAQGMLVARRMLREGLPLVVYDPQSLEKAKKVLRGQVFFARTASECIRDSDVILVATPWEEFKKLPARLFVRFRLPRVVIDCWRILGHFQRSSKIKYLPLGRYLGTLSSQNS